MSVNTHISPANSNTAVRSRCLWLKFKAKTLLVFGLRTKAHETFQEILDINPADALALNSLAYEELNNRRLVQSLSYFERALVQTPNTAKAGAVKYNNEMKNKDHATDSRASRTEGTV